MWTAIGRAYRLSGDCRSRTTRAQAAPFLVWHALLVLIAAAAGFGYDMLHLPLQELQFKTLWWPAAVCAVHAWPLIALVTRRMRDTAIPLWGWLALPLPYLNFIYFLAIVLSPSKA